MVLLCAGAALRGERVDACASSGPTLADLSTFDPAILGEGFEALQYDPMQAGHGEACQDCLNESIVDDWMGYFGGGARRDDVEHLLFETTSSQLVDASRALVKNRALPEAIGASLYATPARRAKLRSALPVVVLARQFEELAEASGPLTVAKIQAQLARGGRVRRGSIKSLLEEARAGHKAATEPFLAQRYAFLHIKALFYAKRWEELVQTFDGDEAALLAPSQGLGWRARYYLAGALARTGARGRANLELARVHAGSPALAGAAANDFRPVEEADWRESLRLAKTTQEKVWLWRLVGVTRDGLVAMREIQKLDARSPLLHVLLVRELERAEGRTADPWGTGVDANAAARQQRDFAAIEALALANAAAGGERAWLGQLVAAHVAAKRGDLATTQSRLAAALRAQPKNERVEQQAKASLALALALDVTGHGKPAPQLLATRSDEVAAALLALRPEFGRFGHVRAEVGSLLATAYAASGKLVEAELLSPGYLESSDKTAGKWREPAFLQAMLTRASAGTAPLDKLLREGYSPMAIREELALYHLANGELARAAHLFGGGRAASYKLGTDPFVIHIRDCHDCDHERYADAPWTHATAVARMAQLEKKASGSGEEAAAAALELGNAYYNLSWYGNARGVLAYSHQQIRAPKAAERWYKRAYDLSKSRERRAEAAFLAAKAELGSLLTAAEKAAGAGPGQLAIDPLPVPTNWFPVVERYADTKYGKEVLAECSHFRAFTTRGR